MSSSSEATNVFIFGLLSIVLCPILGPIAWSQGNQYHNMCLLNDETPDGMAVAGRIMGMIGTAQLALVAVVFALSCCAGVLTD